ncbi:hypothetical protein CgunFtcFv8_002232 [Champsocephalus gunnari]|uniref:G-protein coupled receptors family 2 profile 2 domain-containing protein n=1 Tax=Champsocephalus gunnari TaxID=52237 RepID=A0AAN8CMB5_CHAGU|nr:hypothetical protein CgunFtcFv8_002232 [Champsocephalus gunnari]
MGKEEQWREFSMPFDLIQIPFASREPEIQSFKSLINQYFIFPSRITTLHRCSALLLLQEAALHAQRHPPPPVASFMLRSLAVVVKDVVLFADKSTDHCTVSTLWCKAAVTFFHFCVLCNFCWLLVEGLYLQSLLLFTFSHTTKLFRVYAVIGCGTPSVTLVIWALLKNQLDDEGCWDNLESRLWWIIKIPILLSIFVNLGIFLNISRIIVQKTKATHVNQSDTRLYRTLLRSTLLLIPLFGVHYMVFALIPEHLGVGPRLYFELVLGSLQGFIVALLYCYLNGERTLRRWWPKTETNAINLPTQEYVP